MPQPPKPNAGRAIVGFVIGLVVGVIVVGIVRFLQGLPIHIIFWDDESTFMFTLLFGALGFVWGAGAVYDFSKEEEHSRALKPRIPVDPDAPRVTSNPVMALLEAIPSMGMVIAAMVIAVVILGGIVLSGQGAKQLTNEAGDTHTFGTESYNLVGLVEIENTSQATLFLVFAAIVIGGVFSIGAGLAMIFWLLNRQVRVATESKPEPSEGEMFLPIRIATFFTDWMLDILDSVKGIVAPR